CVRMTNQGKLNFFDVGRQRDQIDLLNAELILVRQTSCDQSQRFAAPFEISNNLYVRSRRNRINPNQISENLFYHPCNPWLTICFPPTITSRMAVRESEKTMFASRSSTAHPAIER